MFDEIDLNHLCMNCSAYHVCRNHCYQPIFCHYGTAKIENFKYLTVYENLSLIDMLSTFAAVLAL